jgi:predicted Ser/Thr protein kinase
LSLTPGTRLGPYDIDSLLGAGGMGEVYRARDTRLNRLVAIKVLADTHAADAEFRSRFEQEARIIASLNHPHICTVYDVGLHQGRHYIVMEFIEGSSLAERLKRGRLGVDEALTYAIQIAGALERAHRAGIVHRDLKPGNVMVTKGGVKLVDFGLAKTAEPAVVASGLSALATSPANVTAPGRILGTLQYMAPEQIEGAESDARTDIFSFGAMCYEMLTGQKAFDAKTAAGLLGAILKDQPPPIETYQPQAPRGLNRVVQTCLAKDPDDRWQSARDIRRELQWIAEGAVDPAGPAIVQDRPAPRWWIVAAAALTALVGGLGAAVWWQPAPPEPAVTRWTFPTASVGNSTRIAVSREAHAIVYEAIRPDGVQQLFVRRRDQLEPVAVRGTEGAVQLAISPDAAWILFVAGKQLLKVPFDGGPVTPVCDVPPNVVGLSWGPRDQIVFGSADGLFRVPAAGGAPTAITRVNAAEKETAHGWPVILDDGESIVFVVSRATIPEIAVTTMAGETPRLLVRGTHPRVTSTGDLLFTRGSTVWGTRLDAARTRLVREPVPVVEGVSALLSGYTAFDVAANGTLVYRPRQAQSHQLSWVTRDGRSVSAATERFDGIYHGPPALSPDGRHLAIARHPTNGQDQIAIYDLQRGIQTVLTGVAGTSRWPVWTRDGSHLTFASEREGSWDLFELPANGAGAPQPLLVAPDDQWPWSWSPDDQTLGYVGGRVGVFDIFFLPRGGKPYQLPQIAGSRAASSSPAVQFSPDGRWIAYQSDESGRLEVYVRPFSGAQAAVQVSTTGGRYPIWSRRGDEILYLSGTDRVMSVSMKLTDEPVLGQPTELFRMQFGNDGSRPYDVAADGRLLAIQDLNTSPASIVVVEQWTQELDRLLGAR